MPKVTSMLLSFNGKVSLEANGNVRRVEVSGGVLEDGTIVLNAPLPSWAKGKEAQAVTEVLGAQLRVAAEEYATIEKVTKQALDLLNAGDDDDNH